MRTTSVALTRTVTVTVAMVSLAIVATLTVTTVVSGAPCASSPTIPTDCNDASSCIAGGDICNVCAEDFWLADVGTGECDLCITEATAAHDRLSGTSTCNQDNATFFFDDCFPVGAQSEASCTACNEACSACNSTSDDKMAGCTTCATGYYDDNGLQEGGICSVIMFETEGSILGMAEQFGALGAATVTNGGPTIIVGDIGVSPGVAITGFPPGVIVGEVHATDPTASTAVADAGIAFLDLAGRAAEVTMSGTDLGGLTLVPGVYKYDVAAALTGDLTLTANGDPDGVFVFQIGSSLTVANHASVVLAGGAVACNVYWQVGSSATLGVGAAFVGNIIAQASVSLGTGTSLQGRAIALTAAVTMLSNAITTLPCGGPQCAGPHFLTEATETTDANCTACDVSCAMCTSVTANMTDGCDECAYGYYGSDVTNNTCTECRSHESAADARVSGTTSCDAAGAQFFFQHCMRGSSTDAACMPVSTEAELSAAIQSTSTTCSDAGAYFFVAAEGEADARCAACSSGCDECSATTCTQCSSSMEAAGTGCAPIISAAPTNPGTGTPNYDDSDTNYAPYIIGGVAVVAVVAGAAMFVSSRKKKDAAKPAADVEMS